MSEELDNLVLQGAQIDAGIETESKEAAGINNTVDLDAAAMEWVIVPELLAWVITSIYPETEKQYTQEKKMGLARAIAPVAEKYGLSGVGDSPELMLCVAGFGFGMPAYMAHTARKKLAQEQQQQEQGAENGGQ